MERLSNMKNSLKRFLREKILKTKKIIHRKSKERKDLVKVLLGSYVKYLGACGNLKLIKNSKNIR
jgi:hypothetical protein